MPKKNNRPEENEKAFKHWINKSLLERTAASLKKIHPTFDETRFVKLASRLEPLELKARVRLVRDQLRDQLPKNYEKALSLLIKSTHEGKLKGFDLWPYTEFIQTYGLDHPQESLLGLYQLTSLFTGEFAVRPFLIQDPTQTLKFLLKCAEDKNFHVRRWASEGSRPRLPWGERLHMFIENPKSTLDLLEKLKYDEELYVRKSVANHLNDIAKDHPLVVIETLTRWKNSTPENHSEKIKWITYRALRTLIKDGHPLALKLIDVNTKVKIQMSSLSIRKKNFKIGERIEFKFSLSSKQIKEQKLVIDYAIHFVKANKKVSRKVFKLKKILLPGKGHVTVSKTHHLKKITTRVYYPGKHFLEVQINGKSYGKLSFNISN